MRSILCIALMAISLSIHAQILNVDKVRFGRISDEELSMTTYAPDPEAKAVVLYDEAIVRFELSTGQNSFQFLMERHLRIKILDDAAVDYGNFSYLLEESTSSSATERMDRVRGATYNLVNGEEEETKLTNDGIFEERISENLRSLKIVFPQVRAGSVIELTYQLRSDFLYNLPTWYFQRRIPVDYSYFDAEIPEYYLYNLDMQGFEGDRLVINEVGGRGSGSALIRLSSSSGGRPNTSLTPGSANRTGGTRRVDFSTRQYKWAALEVPALPEEPFAPDPINFFFRVSFELNSINFPGQLGTNFSRSWEDVCDTYLGGGQTPYLKPRNAVEDLAAAWTADLDSEFARAAAVYEGVKDEIVWDGNYRIFPSQTPNALLNSKSGSSAEINFLLLSALRAAEVGAQPVLLSTRANGYLSITRPSLSQFNHVVVGVVLSDGSAFLLDATKNDVPAPLLPTPDINDRGRVIQDDESSSWINMVAPASQKVATQLHLTLGTDGSLTGSGKLKYEDYGAVDFRRDMESEDQVASRLSEELGATLSELEIEHFSNIYEDIVISGQMDFSSTVMNNNELLYLPSILVRKFEKNPFVAEERRLPIDLVVPREYVYVMEISLADGLQIEELPESINLALPENKGRYSLRFLEANDKLQIIERLTFSESLYSVTDYQALRNFMELVLENEESFIVIKAVE